MKLTDRTELLRAMRAEIKHQLRYNPRVKGSDRWKLFEKTAKPYVHLPLWPILVTDKNETGRSEKYHAERVEEMTLRAELGMDLWGKDEPADTEDFIGTELTEKEREFIVTMLSCKGEDTAKKREESDKRRLLIMGAYRNRLSSARKNESRPYTEPETPGVQP